MDAVQQGSFTRTDRFGDNRDPTFPEFMVVAVQDDLATQRQGYPIFRDEEHVRIHMPGNNLSIPVERVNEGHIRRWPEHYKEFKAGREMSHQGTPLEMWPVCGKSQVLFLKHHGIHTVEEMSDVSDFNLSQLGMGARQLRDLAKTFLDSAARNAMTNSLMKENDKLATELLDAQKQIVELKNLIGGMQVQIEGLAARPNIIANHVPGQHDPYAAFASPAAQAPAPAPVDPLATFASRTTPEAA